MHELFQEAGNSGQCIHLPQPGFSFEKEIRGQLTLDGKHQIMGYDVVSENPTMVLVVSHPNDAEDGIEEYRMMVTDLAWPFAANIAYNLFASDFQDIVWFVHHMF